MTTSCLLKQKAIKVFFSQCQHAEARYSAIIEMGKKLIPLDAQHKNSENLVKGCQSTMYLHAALNEGTVIFSAESDAMISAGLAALLIEVYSGETPETILTCAPTYLEDLGLRASLTPSRANGLYSIHLKMKQEALRLLLETQSLGLK
jgi:sulfur transfer protein SufE